MFWLRSRRIGEGVNMNGFEIFWVIMAPIMLGTLIIVPWLGDKGHDAWPQ